ncbi:MAG TPA: hypothetical protein VHE30_29905 [Polyangiaceae bacterium]|nr:hypothetical protein [Polyangiaceae bacterium]
MTKQAEIVGYAGPERRTRKVYVTENSEYHVQRGVCVAVRDRRSMNFVLVHPALRRCLSGSVRFTKRLEPRPSLDSPRLGEGLFFGDGGPEVVTSNVVAVERPEKRTVTAYPV